MSSSLSLSWWSSLGRWTASTGRARYFIGTGCSDINCILWMWVSYVSQNKPAVENVWLWLPILWSQCSESEGQVRGSENIELIFAAFVLIKTVSLPVLDCLKLGDYRRTPPCLSVFSKWLSCDECLSNSVTVCVFIDLKQKRYSLLSLYPCLLLWENWTLENII